MRNIINFYGVLSAILIVLPATTQAEPTPEAMGSRFYQILHSEPACKSLNSVADLNLKFRGSESSSQDKTFQAHIAVDRQFEMNPAGVLNVTSSLNKSSFTVYFDNHNFSAFRGKWGPSCESHPAQCESILNDFVALLNQVKSNPVEKLSAQQEEGIECALKLADTWKGGLEARYSVKMGPAPSSVSSSSMPGVFD